MKSFALRHFLDTCPPGTLVHHELFIVYTEYVERLAHELPAGRSQRLRCIQAAITCDFWAWLVEQDVLSTWDHPPRPLPQPYLN